VIASETILRIDDISSVIIKDLGIAPLTHRYDKYADKYRK
jgi:hypothetical protein